MAKTRTKTTKTKQRARGPKAGRVLYDGSYLVGRESPRGMIITAWSEEGREEAREAMGTPDAQKVFFEMFEDWIGNGWTWIPPETIGALTDGEIISPDAHIDDDGEIAFDTKRPRIYWFSDYQVVDPLEQWSKGKGVVFDLAKVETKAESSSKRPTAPSELDVTRIIRNYDMWDFSHSQAEGGPMAGPETWNAALQAAGELRPRLVTSANADEIRRYFSEFGAWDDEELASMSAKELSAMLIQFIAGDYREQELIAKKARALGRNEEDAVEQAMEGGRISGNLYRSGPRWYYSIG